MRFVKCGSILIAADNNSRSKAWHYLKTNSRGRKLEEYLASKHLHVLNKERGRSTFLNSRGSSNVDLTITNNNLIAAVDEFEVSEEESLSDYNYLKYRISEGGASKQNNDYTCQGTVFIIKEEKLHFSIEN